MICLILYVSMHRELLSLYGADRGDTLLPCFVPVCMMLQYVVCPGRLQY